jgi:hypothetical protein
VCVCVCVCVCVFSILGLLKRKFHIYSTFFLLNAPDLHPTLQIQIFAPSPFMFLLSQIIPVCAVSAFGDLTHSVVIICSLFQLEQPLDYFMQWRSSGNKFPQFHFSGL